MLDFKCSVFVICLCFLFTSSCGSGIPIWELLRYEEKLGRLMYIFVQLVEKCCKSSDLEECRKTVIMDGVSNLLNKTEESLDLLDPYQKNGHLVIWEAATKSEHKCPTVLAKNGSEILLDALRSVAGIDK